MQLEDSHIGLATGPVIASSIVEPGRNCSRSYAATRAAVLVDGQSYFSRLAQSLSKAHHSVFIIAWDFDGAIRLDPARSNQTVGELLRWLVDNRSDLHVRVLVWSEATIHAPGSTMPLLIGDTWSDHPRISVELDKRHPIYAAHHQKIVSIDDEIAFVGGMDLTVDRWDTPEHATHSALRVTPDGTPYDPVHDVQMVVEGDAARALAAIARRRWQAATGEEVPPSLSEGEGWPEDLAPQFENVSVAISTASPNWRGDNGCRQSFQMTLDAIAAARSSIYLEAQYFTSRRVGEAIAASLARPEGPEILVVVGLNSHGLIEHYVMGRNRDRLARKLKKRDPYGRFRIYYPRLPSGKDLKLHSKVMVIDDTFVRVGSSNLNNRSEGLDTECDVSIEATTAATSAVIAAVRDALLAEHLGVDTAIVRRVVSEERSLFGAIDKLNANARRLESLPGVSRRGPTWPVFLTWLLDPARPFLSGPRPG
jgi:phosphatidylserine/phosphatidylglycerophosphate/cardiolipin synthase-like enzyme